MREFSRGFLFGATLFLVLVASGAQAFASNAARGVAVGSPCGSDVQALSSAADLDAARRSSAYRANFLAAALDFEVSNAMHLHGRVDEIGDLASVDTQYRLIRVADDPFTGAQRQAVEQDASDANRYAQSIVRCDAFVATSLSAPGWPAYSMPLSGAIAGLAAQMSQEARAYGADGNPGHIKALVSLGSALESAVASRVQRYAQSWRRAGLFSAQQ